MTNKLNEYDKKFKEMDAELKGYKERSQSLRKLNQ